MKHVNFVSFDLPPEAEKVFSQKTIEIIKKINSLQGQTDIKRRLIHDAYFYVKDNVEFPEYIISGTRGNGLRTWSELIRDLYRSIVKFPIYKFILCILICFVGSLFVKRKFLIYYMIVAIILLIGTFIFLRKEILIKEITEQFNPEISHSEYIIWKTQKNYGGSNVLSIEKPTPSELGAHLISCLRSKEFDLESDAEFVRHLNETKLPLTYRDVSNFVDKLHRNKLFTAETSRRQVSMKEIKKWLLKCGQNQ